jgi:hypothetical protein
MDAPDDTSCKPRGKRVSASYPYSNRQLDIIRAALNAHYDYFVVLDETVDDEKEDKQPKRQTWQGIAEAIEESTGVKMGDEALRRFAKSVGKHKKQGPPMPKNMKAIVDYLTDPGIAELSLEELEEDKIDYQPAIRLRDYLRQDLDTDSTVPASWGGPFRAQFEDEGRRTVIDLDLDVRTKDGVILVTESRVIFGEGGHARQESRGWAVITPEDNMLFFMKDEPFRRNHYWSMAGDLVTYQFERDRLALLRQEYPPEVDSDLLTGENATEALHDHVERNVFLFERTGVTLSGVIKDGMYILADHDVR